MTDRLSAIAARHESLRVRREAVKGDSVGKGDSVAGVPELRLSDLLDDPMTRQVMASDRIDIRDLSRLMARIRGQLASRALAGVVADRAGRHRRPKRDGAVGA